MNQEIYVELPVGWEMKIDPRNGRSFFIDHKTRSTSWSNPRELNNTAVIQPIKSLKQGDASSQQSSQHNNELSGKTSQLNDKQEHESTIINNKGNLHDFSQLSYFFDTPNANFQAWLNVNHRHSIPSPSSVYPSNQTIQDQTSFNPQSQAYLPQQGNIYSYQTIAGASSSSPAAQPYPPVPGSRAFSSVGCPQSSSVLSNGWVSQSQQLFYTNGNITNQSDYNSMQMEPFSQGSNSSKNYKDNQNFQDNQKVPSNVQEMVVPDIYLSQNQFPQPQSQPMGIDQDRQSNQYIPSQYPPRSEMALPFQGGAVNGRVYLPGVTGSSGMPYPNSGQNNNPSFQRQCPTDSKFLSERPREQKFSQENEKSSRDQDFSPGRTLQGQGPLGVRQDMLAGNNTTGQYQQYEDQSRVLPTSQGPEQYYQHQTFDQQEKPVASMNYSEQSYSLDNAQQLPNQQTGSHSMSAPLPNQTGAAGYTPYPTSQPGHSVAPGSNAQSPRLPMASSNVPPSSGYPVTPNSMAQRRGQPMTIGKVPSSSEYPVAPNAIPQQPIHSMTAGNLPTGQPKITSDLPPSNGKPMTPRGVAQLPGHPMASSNQLPLSRQPMAANNVPLSSGFSSNTSMLLEQPTSTMMPPRHPMPTPGQPTLNNSILPQHGQAVAINTPQSPSRQPLVSSNMRASGIPTQPGQPMASSQIPHPYGQGVSTMQAETSMTTNNQQHPGQPMATNQPPQYVANTSISHQPGRPMTSVNTPHSFGQPAGASGIAQQPSDGPRPSGQPNSSPQHAVITRNLPQQPSVADHIPQSSGQATIPTNMMQPHGQPIATNDPTLANQQGTYPPVSNANYYQQPNTRRLGQANQASTQSGLYPTVPSSPYRSQERLKLGDSPVASNTGYTEQIGPSSTMVQRQTNPHPQYPTDHTCPHPSFPKDHTHPQQPYLTHPQQPHRTDHTQPQQSYPKDPTHPHQPYPYDPTNPHQQPYPPDPNRPQQPYPNDSSHPQQPYLTHQQQPYPTESPHLQQPYPNRPHQQPYPTDPNRPHQQPYPTDPNRPQQPYLTHQQQPYPTESPHPQQSYPNYPQQPYPTDPTYPPGAYPAATVAYPTKSYNTSAASIPQSPSQMPTAPHGYSVSSTKGHQHDKIQRARIEMIDRVLCFATELEPQVFNFSGRRGDKEYLNLEEQLTRYILELDKIQTDGIEDIRIARKSAIHRVQHLIDTLEVKS